MYRLEMRYPSVPDLATLRQGCWREEAVTIRYADRNDAVTERTILPLATAYLDRKLMVLASCCLREGFRMFQADRVSEAAIAGQSFRPRRVPLLRDFMAELRPRE